MLDYEHISGVGGVNVGTLEETLGIKHCVHVVCAASAPSFHAIRQSFLQSLSIPASTSFCTLAANSGFFMCAANAAGL